MAVTQEYLTTEPMSMLKTELASSNPDAGYCYDLLRKVPETFLPCTCNDTLTLHRKLIDFLLELGALSTPLTVGLTMHLYTLAAMATLPKHARPGASNKINRFLKIIKQQKWIVASCGSFRTTQQSNQASAIPVSNGFVVTGQKDFVSLAGVADKIIVGVETADDNIVVFMDNMNNRHIRLGELMFIDSMNLSCTRAIIFDEYPLKQSDILFAANQKRMTSFVALFQRIWFQALIMAPYLAAARMAIDEIIQFGKNNYCKRSKQPLSNDSVFINYVGQLMTKYEAAKQFCYGMSYSIESASSTVKCEELLHSTAAAKSCIARLIKDIVSDSRDAIGTESLKPDSRLYLLDKQVNFCTMHPTNDRELALALGELAVS